MGNIGFTKEHFDVEKYTFPYLRDVNYPSDREKSPYDELEGFPNGRKERVMVATEEEMDSAKLIHRYRDYCAHKLIDLQGCLKNNRPFYWRCSHERHAFNECEFEDLVLRMKEWERERRLREREKKQQQEAI